MALTKHLSSKQSANKDSKAKDDQNEKQACKPTAPSGSQSKTTTASAKQSTGGGRAKGKQPQEPVELCNICKVTGRGSEPPRYYCKQCNGLDICKHNRLRRSCKDCKHDAD